VSHLREGIEDSEHGDNQAPRRDPIRPRSVELTKLQRRLFELRDEAPPDVLMPLHAQEYRVAAELGWRRDKFGVALIGVCKSEDGNSGSYRFMLDKHALASIRNRDVFSFGSMS
jgi:hypothetical protein